MLCKILTIVLIFSNYITFSISICRASFYFPEPLFARHPHFRTHLYSTYNKLDCLNINLTEETPLNQKFNSSNIKVKVLRIFDSYISKLYVNTFDEFETFEQVTISNSSLSTIEPNTFQNWNELLHLDLSYNQLTSIDFHLPSNIMYLYITHNKISHLKDFRNYNKLSKLNLSYNSIRSIENFGPFNALSYLDLSNNYITSLINITWKSGQMLDSLILSHNYLKYMPKIIESVLITNLDISFNNISTIDCKNVTLSINLSHNNFAEICNFSKTIKKIDFSYNKITHIYERTFEDLKQLEFLNLSHNSIETIYPGAFHDLISLQHLNLNDNIIPELPMGLFYHLENLINLSIATNHLETLEHGIFTGLNRLRFLDISNNKIYNIDAIYTLQYLKELNIIDNNLYQLDVDQITKHLQLLSKIRFNIARVTSCEELTVYLLEFNIKYVTVEEGDYKYKENVHGIHCQSKSNFEINKQETDEQRLEYIANYLSGISTSLIVILIILVFIIISTLFTIYQIFVKQRKQTEIDRNVQSCTLKLLTENDP